MRLGISIHALLAESDLADCTKIYAFGDFYPRSPCGERHNAGPLPTVCTDFYPRSPCGERLKEVEKLSRVTVISIHALLAESDANRLSRQSRLPAFLSTLSLRRATPTGGQTFEINLNFYPRSPCGERLRRLPMADFDKIFLSTLSLRRATRIPQDQLPNDGYFYPRSPCGERQKQN